jgi:DNA-binding beta-propeller fold protein YncE
LRKIDESLAGSKSARHASGIEAENILSRIKGERKDMKIFHAMLGVAFAVFAAWPCSAPLASPAPGAPGATPAVPLKMLVSIPIPGLKDGDFDHFAVDLAGHRLFLTAEKNSAVEVFDLNTNKLIHTIAGLDEPHSMLYRDDLKNLFVIDGGAAEVRMYDATSYKYLGGIKLKDDCDSMAYDPATKYLYVVNGGRGAHEAFTLISIIDTTAAKKLADIKIDTDSVEALALEKAVSRLFVNMTGLNSVGVLDREKHAQLATWSVADVAQHNVPLVFDEATHRLFLATSGKPEKFAVLDSDSGKVVASLQCASMVDDMAFDPGASASTLQEPILSMFFNKRMPIITNRSGTFLAAFAPRLRSWCLS